MPNHESFKNNDTKEYLEQILQELRSMNEKQGDAVVVLRQIHVQLNELNK